MLSRSTNDRLVQLVMQNNFDAVLDMVRSEGASLIAGSSRDDYEFERRDIEIHPVERAADWSAV